VIIGAPYAPSEQLINQLRISVVCHGMQPTASCSDGTDPYAAAKKLGIYQNVDSGCEIQTGNIIDRILKNRLAYEERNRKKEAKEVSEAAQ
jgi:ethanolamine-phosphate cytidylyltransferase